jgi:hypothetical protein
MNTNVTSLMLVSASFQALWFAATYINILLLVLVHCIDILFVFSWTKENIIIPLAYCAVLLGQLLYFVINARYVVSLENTYYPPNCPNIFVLISSKFITHSPSTNGFIYIAKINSKICLSRLSSTIIFRERISHFLSERNRRCLGIIWRIPPKLEFTRY